MKIKAADLRHVIVIQEMSKVPDGLGGYKAEWVDKGTLWAFVEPLSMDETLTAQKLGYSVTHRVIIRQDATIKPHENRIKHRNRILEIVAINDPYESGEFFELKCILVV